MDHRYISVVDGKGEVVCSLDSELRYITLVNGKQEQLTSDQADRLLFSNTKAGRWTLRFLMAILIPGYRNVLAVDDAPYRISEEAVIGVLRFSFDIDFWQVTIEAWLEFYADYLRKAKLIEDELEYRRMLLPFFNCELPFETRSDYTIESHRLLMPMYECMVENFGSKDVRVVLSDTGELDESDCLSKMPLDFCEAFGGIQLGGAGFSVKRSVEHWDRLDNEFFEPLILVRSVRKPAMDKRLIGVLCMAYHSKPVWAAMDGADRSAGIMELKMVLIGTIAFMMANKIVKLTVLSLFSFILIFCTALNYGYSNGTVVERINMGMDALMLAWTISVVRHVFRLSLPRLAGNHIYGVVDCLFGVTWILCGTWVLWIMGIMKVSAISLLPVYIYNNPVVFSLSLLESDKVVEDLLGYLINLFNQNYNFEFITRESVSRERSFCHERKKN